MMLKELKPQLFTPSSIERKKEMISEIYSVSFIFRIHVLNHCPKNSDCEVCKKLTCVVNIFLEEELKHGGKTDFKKLKQNMILDSMIFGDGIQIS